MEVMHIAQGHHVPNLSHGKWWNPGWIVALRHVAVVNGSVMYYLWG